MFTFLNKGKHILTNNKMETILSKEVNYNCDTKWNYHLKYMFNMIKNNDFIVIFLNINNCNTNVNYQGVFKNEFNDENYHIFTLKDNCYIINPIDIDKIDFDQYNRLNIILTKIIKKKLTKTELKEKNFLTIEDKNYIFNSNDVQKDLPF